MVPCPHLTPNTADWHARHGRRFVAELERLATQGETWAVEKAGYYRSHPGVVNTTGAPPRGWHRRGPGQGRINDPAGPRHVRCMVVPRRLE